MNFRASLVSLLLGVAFLQAQELTIVPGKESYDSSRMPVLAAVDWNKPDWRNVSPVWTAATNGRKCVAWVGAADQGLLLKVIVTSAAHTNPYADWLLWRGAALFVGLDARGDTSASDAKANVFGMDDTSYIFGLGRNGPDAGVEKAGNPDVTRADLLAMIRSMTRDENTKTTCYEIAVPWDKVGSARGQSTSMGIALTVKDDVLGEGEDLNWGSIRGRQNPRIFNRFALPDDGREVLSAVALKSRLLRATDTAKLSLSVRSARATELTVSIGATHQAIHVPASTALNFFTVGIPAGLTGPDADVAAVEFRQDGQSAAENEFPIVSPKIIYARLEKRINTLLQNPPHPLVKEHLESTRKVVRSVYENLETPGDRGKGVDEPDQFVKTVQIILSKLPETCFDWDKHLRQGLPLVMAFVSSKDCTLQFYALHLPFNWKEAETYPLTVYLHGMGSPLPIGGLSWCFDCQGYTTVFQEKDIEPANIPAGHTGFIVAPWGRGNSHYKEYAADDFWQIMEIVKKRFKIDTRRMYISGFSMGCAGAIDFATYRPDVWAGACLASGFHDPHSASFGDKVTDRNDYYYDKLAENLRGLPLYIWVGEADAMMLGGAKKFMAVMDRKGIAYDAKIVPTMPHTYPFAEFHEGLRTLMKKAQEPTNEFRFTTDNPRYNGIRGVEMNVKAPVNPNALPQMSCRIANNVITVDTRNVDELCVHAGADGLALSGPVRIVWNGKEAYTGEGKTVSLPSAAP